MLVAKDCPIRIDLEKSSQQHLSQGKTFNEIMSKYNTCTAFLSICQSHKFNVLCVISSFVSVNKIIF